MMKKDELKRRMQELKVKNKELEFQISDLKLVLHHHQTGTPFVSCVVLLTTS